MQIGEKIKNLRIERGLTQKQLGDILDVSRACVSKWESNDGFPSRNNIVSMSKLFGVTTDYFLSEDDDIKPKTKKIKTKKPKNKFKIILPIVLSLSAGALAMSVIGAVALANRTPIEEELPPAQIYSITFQYNNENINGQLTADLSKGTVMLSAKVVKDADATGTITYSSSKTDIATIDNNGLVSLHKKGETILKASIGDKEHQIVLNVTDDSVNPTKYNILIEGGIAKDENGNIITSAGSGDYITLVPVIPDHKKFIDWTYSVSGLWVNGNVIKMPNQSLSVTANYDDQLYNLNLVKAKVTKAGNENNPAYTSFTNSNEYTYQFKYGTEITIEADEAADDKLFVGFDYNFDDNRVGDNGVPKYTFNMGDTESTYTSIYSPMTKSVLFKDKYSEFYDKNGITGTAIKTSTDPDLEGLQGYKLSIPGNAKAITTYPENILSTSINTLSTFQPKTNKVILKNEHPSIDVKCEVYISYYGNMSSTGIITVPHNSVVSTILYCDICKPASTSWGFAIRENLNGSSTDTVSLSLVAGSADTYPNGYPVTKIEADRQLVNFGTTAIEPEVGLLKRNGWGTTGRIAFYDQFSTIFMAAYGSTFTAVNASAYTTVANLPTYDSEKPNTQIYGRIMNLVNNYDSPKNTFTIYVLNGTYDQTETSKIMASKKIVLTSKNEQQLIKLDIPRTSDEGQIYFVIEKTALDGSVSTYAYNTLMQLAYNNAFGYQE